MAYGPTTDVALCAAGTDFSVAAFEPFVKSYLPETFAHMYGGALYKRNVLPCPKERTVDFHAILTLNTGCRRGRGRLQKTLRAHAATESLGHRVAREGTLRSAFQGLHAGRDGHQRGSCSRAL